MEQNGGETMIMAKNGGVSLNIVIHDRAVFAPGERIRLAPMPGCCHFFVIDTGRRLEEASRRIDG